MKINVQAMVFIVFGVAAVVAMLIFSLNINVGPGGSQQIRGSVSVWGTVPFQTMKKYIDNVSTNDLRISYKAFHEDEFESIVVENWASNSGPDLIFAPQEFILRHENKIFHVPYASFSETLYRDTYIDAADLFLEPDGILAFPLLINPLIIYYNRNILSSAFLLYPPEDWDSIKQIGQDLTKINESGLILQSSVALGTYDNIKNAKDIIATLVLQNGNNIIGSGTDSKISLFGVNDAFTLSSVDAVNFYTSFADREEKHYSWNASLQNDTEAFLSGDLAIYFGLADEIVGLRNKNPNLNFDITLFPQDSKTDLKMTFGRMQALAIGKMSKNIPAAIYVASQLSSPETISELSRELFMPPARRDLLSDRSGRGREEILFYESAIISRSWFDPNWSTTQILFKKMIKDIQNGINTVDDAVSRMHRDLESLLR